MIHDNLIQHFESHPEPRLSADFSDRLRARLESIDAPTRRISARDVARRWGPRAYWAAAIVLVIVTMPRVVVSPQQMVTMAAIGVPMLLALQRALGASSLRRVLRDVLLR